MAKYISVDQFIKQTEGHEYDIDGRYGVQCVDGIKKFNLDVYECCDFTCGNGWAYGLWTNYGTNGVEKYFDKYPFSQVKKGDWIVWNKGSKDAPNSHVGMFIEKVGNNAVKGYGQSQNGKKAFSFANINTNGILGVLRPKIYNYLYHKGNYNDDMIKIDNFLADKVKGNTYGDYTEGCVSVYKKKNNLGTDGSFIDDETLQQMKKDGLDI